MVRPEDNAEPDVDRAAIDDAIDERRCDADFLERLEQRHEREKPLFDRLAQ
jgi:hypothetical protein